MSKTYHLLESELAEILEASKPVPYLVFDGVEPSSPYENAMRVWGRIAERVGCDVNTIGPGRTQMEFVARPLKENSDE